MRRWRFLLVKKECTVCRWRPPLRRRLGTRVNSVACGESRHARAEERRREREREKKKKRGGGVLFTISSFSPLSTQDCALKEETALRILHAHTAHVTRRLSHWPQEKEREQREHAFPPISAFLDSLLPISGGTRSAMKGM